MMYQCSKIRPPGIGRLSPQSPIGRLPEPAEMEAKEREVAFWEMTNSELTSHFPRAGVPPRINWRRLGTGDLIWATFPRPNAATSAPISNPFGTLHAFVARSGAQIVTVALTAG